MLKILTAGPEHMQKPKALWDGLQTVRGGAVRKTERLRDMVSEAGQCGELMTLQVRLHSFVCTAPPSPSPFQGPHTLLPRMVPVALPFPLCVP